MSGDRTLALLRRCRGGVAAAAVAVALAAPGLLDSYKNGLLESYELALLDRFFEYRGTRAPTAPIVIISIDEASLVEVNQPWPFPRATHARLIDAVAAGNPLAIGVDLIFDQPSAFGADDDAALGAAVARAGNVVLVAAPVTDHQGFITRQIPNLPVAAVRRGAAVLAALNLTHDQDSKVRRAPQRVSTGVEELPGFALALHRLVAKTDLAAAALPSVDEVIINFNGPPRTFPWVSYYRVVTGEVAPDFFRGRIVLIGPTSEPMHDVFTTPFTRGGNLMPGVEIHANALESAARNRPPRLERVGYDPTILRRWRNLDGRLGGLHRCRKHGQSHGGQRAESRLLHDGFRS